MNVGLLIAQDLKKSCSLVMMMEDVNWEFIKELSKEDEGQKEGFSDNELARAVLYLKEKVEKR